MIDKMFVEGGEKSISHNNYEYRYDNQYFNENNYYDQTKINEANSKEERKNIKFNDIFIK